MLNVDAQFQVYRRWPIEPVKAQGCWLWDRSGERYLDMYGGHAVTATGHGHPRVVEAVEKQLRKLTFYSNVVPLAERQRLCERLVERAPDGLDSVFLLNSGSEANDHALAVARRATGRTRVVSVEGGFHGRTAAALAASGLESYRALSARAGTGLENETSVCPFDDTEALAALVSGDVAAVIVEPVQGLAGAHAMSPVFLQRARELCSRHGALLIFDEVQCGVARTGHFYAAETFGVTPDIVTLAKALGSGLPIAAIVASGDVASSVKPGDLGSTFGGGPVPVASALATLDVIEDEQLEQRTRSAEQAIRTSFETFDGAHVQGAGLLVGLRLPGPASDAIASLRSEGILTGGAIDSHVVRLLPPLVISDDELSLFFEHAMPIFERLSKGEP